MVENVGLEEIARVMELVFVERGLQETIVVRRAYFLSAFFKETLIGRACTRYR